MFKESQTKAMIVATQKFSLSLQENFRFFEVKGLYLWLAIGVMASEFLLHLVRLKCMVAVRVRELGGVVFGMSGECIWTGTSGTHG